MSDVDAWLVDLDGTLYVPGPVKLAMAAELALVGWGSIRTLRAFRHQHEVLRETLSDPVDDPFAEQVRRTAALLGTSDAEVERRVRDWMVRRPGKWLRRFRRNALVLEVERFRDQGGRVALVSDYPARDKLAALGLSELFEVVVASGEPGGPPRLKPAPDGYLRAAELLAVRPERCLVLGDRDDADGAAARAAGMRFRHVT